MKRLIIITLFLAACAACAGAQGLGKGFGPTNNTGDGEFIVDSLSSIGILRTNSIGAYTGAAITVAATDTLKGTLGSWAGKFSAARFQSTAGPDSGASATYTGLVEADTFYTTRTMGGLNSWCGLKSGVSTGTNGLVGSDSAAGTPRVAGTFSFSANAGGWFTYNLLGAAYFYSTGYIYSSGGNIYTSGAGGKMYSDTVYARKRVKAGSAYMDSASGRIYGDTIQTLVLKTSGTATAGKVAWTTAARQAVYIAGLNANCVSTVTPDSAAAAAMGGLLTSCIPWSKTKTDTLVFGAVGAAVTAAGNIKYHIDWFAP